MANIYKGSTGLVGNTPLVELVNIGDIVKVKVIKVDPVRGKIDLSMKPSDLEQ